MLDSYPLTSCALFFQPKIQFLSDCYQLGEEVATSNTSSVTYETRTCCEGLKFKVLANTENTAMVIICVRR